LHHAAAKLNKKIILTQALIIKTFLFLIVEPNFMRTIFLLLYTTCCSIIACSPQKGTVEVDSLSRKVFESLRENDFSKVREIIPNKSGFEKIYTMQGFTGDVDAAFSTFLHQCESDFDSMYNTYNGWSNAVYINTNEVQEKSDMVMMAELTTKIEIDGVVKKISFNGAKVGGRWYYYSNLHWLQQDTSTVTTR